MIPPQTLRAESERLLSLGFRVFPVHGWTGGCCTCGDRACGNQAKHPTCGGWQEIAAQPDRARAELARLDGANLGIALGFEANTFVLDVDPRHGGHLTLSELEAHHGELPCTLTVETSAGGRHFHFRSPERSIGNIVGVAQGLDVKGRGGYVVAPPSVHATGHVYCWLDGEPEEQEIAIAPSWLLELLEKAPGRNGGGFELPKEILAGRRNDILYRFACGLRHYAFAESRIFTILLEENASRCSPPLEEDEVRAIAASAARQEPESFTRAKHTAGDAPAGEASTGPAFLRPVQIGNLPPVSWLIDRLLPAESLSCLFGPPGSGKSFVLLDAALAVARGAPWHGRQTKRGPVILCMAEGGTGLGGRFRAWSKGYGIPLEHLERDAAPVLVSFDVPHLLDPFVLDSWAPAIIANLDGDKAAMTIIDTLSRAIAGGDENSAAFISKAVEAAEALRRRIGGAVVLCHHTGKNPEKGERGSSALRGAVDALFELSGGGGAVELSVRKQ